MKTFLGLVVLSALSAVVAFSDPASDTHVKPAEPPRIAMGERVDISNYLVPGKTTIFDFTSQFCPPCRAIAPSVEKLHKKRSDLAFVSVDINRPTVKTGIDWASPVAKQYELESIPHFRIYGPDGKLIATGDEARAMVNRWIEQSL